MVLPYKVKSKQDIVRHGDVLLLRVDPNAKIREDFFRPVESNIVQRGEITGHAHILKPKPNNNNNNNNNNKSTQILVEADNPAQQYISVERGAEVQLVHQEHKPLEIPEGIFVQIQERRFDPFTGMIARAKD